jgi:hypothetical protein
VSSTLDRILVAIEFREEDPDGPQVVLLSTRVARALVNVAKAAEAYVAAAQADDDAIDALLDAREHNEEENLRDAQKATREDVDDKYDALREALAALNKEPA